MFFSIFKYSETDIGMRRSLQGLEFENPLREYSPIVIPKFLPTIHFLFY